MVKKNEEVIMVVLDKNTFAGPQSNKTIQEKLTTLLSNMSPSKIDATKAIAVLHSTYPGLAGIVSLSISYWESGSPKWQVWLLGYSPQPNKRLL